MLFEENFFTIRSFGVCPNYEKFSALIYPWVKAETNEFILKIQFLSFIFTNKEKKHTYF